LRILLLTLYFTPDLGANAVIMTRLAEELTLLGHQVTVVTAFPHYDKNRIWDAYRGKLVQRDGHGDVRVHRAYLYVPRQKDRLLGRVLNYVSFNLLSTIIGLLSGRQDVILSPSPPLTIGLGAYVIGRLSRTPYVYNVQDIYPDVAIRLGVLKNPSVIALFKALERFVYSRAAAISVISEGFRHNLLAKGVPPEKVCVIPNFVDPDFVRPLPRHNRFSREQGLDDRFVVLFAGNVGLSQGLDSVLEAARLLSDEPDILFLVVGNGVAKPGLVKQVEEMGLENVRFLPFQPHEAVPELYAASDLCLVPLRRGITRDSVPSKVYTIMGAGKPLVAAVDEGSDTWQFVQEVRCGLTVPPEEPEALAQAILALYQDRAWGRALGAKGRERVEQDFTPQAAARKYAELLEQVVAE
jgi:colanic acid biosynthesis glycosyl transferase WcaI